MIIIIIIIIISILSRDLVNELDFHVSAYTPIRFLITYNYILITIVYVMNFYCIGTYLYLPCLLK